MQLLSIGSSTIRRCDNVEVGLTLLEEVITFGTGFEVSYAQAITIAVHFQLSVDQDNGLNL